MTLHSQLASLVALCALAAGCGDAPPVVELATYPLDTLDGVITRNDVAIDTTTKWEGAGSLRITAEEPMTVRLFETGDLDVEDARLLYAAQLRTEDVDGAVYLEMWCHFAGQGEYFSRAIGSALSGTQDWTMQETPFILQPGQNPDLIRLNLVIDGTGVVWIDSLRLTRGARH
jgi:hypothetical protein